MSDLGFLAVCGAILILVSIATSMAGGEADRHSERVMEEIERAAKRDRQLEIDAARHQKAG